jgi:RHS repeat-associated protein
MEVASMKNRALGEPIHARFAVDTTTRKADKACNNGHRRTMKTQPKFLVVLLAIFVVTQAHAMRWYSPSTGRWLTRDPIGEPGFELSRQQQPSPIAGGPNLYAFVANTPLNAIDPLGLVIVGFYGFDRSYRWPNPGNVQLGEYSAIMEMYETVLRPQNQSDWGVYRLYSSRADFQAFFDLLRYLDTNKNGYYDPPCDNEETIKIFGWSWGGASAVELANKINSSSRFKKKDVGLVAVIDPVTFMRPGNHVVPSNVYRLWNRYQRNGGPVLGGISIHGDQLRVADPGKTIANQRQLDPAGPDPRIDHVSIVFIVGQEFVAEFFQ